MSKNVLLNDLYLSKRNLERYLNNQCPCKKKICSCKSKPIPSIPTGHNSKISSANNVTYGKEKPVISDSTAAVADPRKIPTEESSLIAQKPTETLVAATKPVRIINGRVISRPNKRTTNTPTKTTTNISNKTTTNNVVSNEPVGAFISPPTIICNSDPLPGDIFDDIKNDIENVYNAVSGVADSVSQLPQDIESTIYSELVDAQNYIVREVENGFTDAKNVIMGEVQKVPGEVESAVTTIVDEAKKEIKHAVSEVKTVAEDTLKGIETALKYLKEIIGEITSEVTKEILDAINDILSLLNKILKSVGKEINVVMKLGLESMENDFKAINKAIEDSFNGVEDVFNKGIDEVKQAYGEGIFLVDTGVHIFYAEKKNIENTVTELNNKVQKFTRNALIFFGVLGAILIGIIIYLIYENNKNKRRIR